MLQFNGWEHLEEYARNTGLDITPIRELLATASTQFIDVRDLIGGQANTLLRSGKSVNETVEAVRVTLAEQLERQRPNP